MTSHFTDPLKAKDSDKVKIPIILFMQSDRCQRKGSKSSYSELHSVGSLCHTNHAKTYPCSHCNNVSL